MAVYLPPASWAQVEAHAVDVSRDLGTGLTSLRVAVLHALWEAQQPLGAYDLTHRLGLAMEKRVAPNSVYRALDYLEAAGLVCKIASRQSYALLPPEARNRPVVMHCDSCGRCILVDGGHIHTRLARLARREGFFPAMQIVELAGCCAACRQPSPSISEDS